VNDGMRRCPHGHPTTGEPAKGCPEGWVVDVAPAACRLCTAEGWEGIAYNQHPPPGPPARRSVAEVQKDIAMRAAQEPQRPPMRVVDHSTPCVVCGQAFTPNAVKIEVEGGGFGGFRHAKGSPACLPAVAPIPAASAEPTSPCPTCGRSVVADAPLDLPAIRAALTDALAALDSLEAGQAAEQELEELGPPD